MIRQVVMYQVACDGCGIAHDGPDGVVRQKRRGESRADGTHWCPQCRRQTRRTADG